MRVAAPNTISYTIHALRTINFFTWAYKNGMRLTHSGPQPWPCSNLDALLFICTVGQPDLSNNMARYVCPQRPSAGTCTFSSAS